MLTSRAANIHRQHALDLGANAYLVKPYPHDQLLSTVADLVKQSP
jgi:chemosensory pili system protein ChpA (sensor histidine kinase/response regulator)